MRLFCCAFASVLALACVPPQTFPISQLAPNAVVDSTGRQIRIRMKGVSQEQAATRLVQALVEHDIPVTSNQGGIVEARLPRQMGMTAQYEITVRGYVTPTEEGVAVLLFGEESSFHRVDQPPVVLKIGSFDQGRALATWKKLEDIGRVLGQ